MVEEEGEREDEDEVDEDERVGEVFVGSDEGSLVEVGRALK